jgi:hypothetical protein
VIGVAGEYFLLVNVVKWLVPASWARLRPWERWRLRAGLLAVGLVYASIALAILGFIVYGFFFSARPVRWNNFAFAFFYGLFALVCAWRSYECFGRFRREVPANEERSTRPL